MSEDFEKYSEAEWEHLRKRFFSSMLNDTQIAKLGQNVGISWPFKGSDETPAKYIDFTLEELNEVPGLVGKQKRIHSLMDILRETLAFDDPFGDMVDTVESESEVDDTFERILAKLNIPTNYPAAFVHFSDDTISLLDSEDLQTLIEVIHFGQRLAQNVVVGGDLKSFLNGLAHKDEVGIARHIPYRRGEKGIHLAEAIGLIVADLPEAAQLDLLRRSGVDLTAEESEKLAKAGSLTMEGALKKALEDTEKRCEWFKAEASDLENVFSTGGSPERFFISMNNPRLERVAVALGRLKFGHLEAAKRGFFGKLFNR